MAESGRDAAVLIDTSVLVRYLTGDPPGTAVRARAIIDEGGDVFLCDVVLLETAHVLRAVYGVPRTAIIDALVLFVRRANVRTVDHPKDIVAAALELCRPSGRVSIADALIWASAKAAGVPVITFDARFPRHGIEVLGG